VKSFSYAKADSVAASVNEAAMNNASKFIAGGTNLIDLMKENVTRPTRLIDITQLPLDKIEETPDGGLRLGALVTNADTAYNEQVEKRYPLLSKTILAGARHNCVTWQQWAEICCSEHAVITFMIQRHRAINVNLEQAVLLLMVSTVSTRF
jgi:hypothetical protein